MQATPADSTRSSNSNHHMAVMMDFVRSLIARGPVSCRGGTLPWCCSPAFRCDFCCRLTSSLHADKVYQPLQYWRSSSWLPRSETNSEQRTATGQAWQMVGMMMQVMLEGLNFQACIISAVYLSNHIYASGRYAVRYDPNKGLRAVTDQDRSIVLISMLWAQVIARHAFVGPGVMSLLSAV